jgi:hypothetical protein
MPERKYRVISEWYVSEFCGLNYPPGSWFTNVPLGEAKTYDILGLTEEEKKMITKPFRPVVDALVLLDEEVHLIEAKIRDDRGKIEQLLLYEYLFPRTPEFQAHASKRIRKILLTPKPAGDFEKFLARFGIEIVYYRPAWIEEYLGSLEAKYRRITGYSVSFD